MREELKNSAIQAAGHTVRLIAPKFVTPYRMSGKNDAADAAPICEAVSRPQRRFVPIKSLDQQARLMVHRARQGFVEPRTATLNRLRERLAEFDMVRPRKANTVRRRVCACLEDLPGWANTVIGDLAQRYSDLMGAWRRTTPTSRPSPSRTSASAH